MTEWDPKWGPPPPPPDAGTRALAEVRSGAPARPAEVSLVVLVTIVSGLASLYLFAQRSSWNTACWVVLEGPLLYFLWTGRNWARVLATVLSMLSVAAIAFVLAVVPAQIWEQLGGFVRVKLIIDAALAAASIAGLNTRAAREFFVASSLRR